MYNMKKDINYILNALHNLRCCLHLVLNIKLDCNSYHREPLQFLPPIVQLDLENAFLHRYGTFYAVKYYTFLLSYSEINITDLNMYLDRGVTIYLLLVPTF